MTWSTRIINAAAALATFATVGAAQNVPARVAAVGTGTLRFSYETKPDVCGNGSSNVSWGNGRQTGTTISTSRGRRTESEYDCNAGPARVALDVDHGHVVDLRYYVAGRWSPAAEGEDLGLIPSATASSYLISLFESAEGSVADHAIVPAIIAKDGDPYPALLRLAKDKDRPQSVRKNAVFWLGQLAGEVATRGLSDIVASEDDREVRKQAIFALSQQRNGVATDALVDVVRNNKDPELRKTALFWLGQSSDPKAFALIEELVLKR